MQILSTRRTKNSVITTPSSMSHHIASGLHVPPIIPFPRVSQSFFSQVLVPHISYQGLLEDCGNDISLKSHLELAKEYLTACHQEQYMPRTPATSTQQHYVPQSPSTSQLHSTVSWLCM